MGLMRALWANPGIRNALRRRILSAKGNINRWSGRRNDDTAIYEKMRNDNASSKSIYTSGEFWARHNHRHAAAIWGGGLESLRNEYFNRTFSGPEPESRQVYKALLFLYLKHIQSLDTGGFLEQYEDPEIGGTSDQEMIDGKRLSLDFLQSIEEMYLIRKAWKESGRKEEPQTLLELGGGYGRLAYVCKKMLPKCTYIMLDLPEALICSQSWLTRVLPGEVSPYSTELSKDDLHSGKVHVFLPHIIESIPDNSIDTFINIYSFAEMPKGPIDNYFLHLNRITSGTLFTKQRIHEINTLDSIEITEDSYPLSHQWSQLSHEPSTLYDNFFQASYSKLAKPDVTRMEK